MNKIYKVVWSKVKNCYVVVSEIAKNVITGSVNSAKIGSTPMTKGLALGAVMAFVITGNVWAADISQETVIGGIGNQDNIPAGATTDGNWTLNGHKLSINNEALYGYAVWANGYSFTGVDGDGSTLEIKADDGDPKLTYGLGVNGTVNVDNLIIEAQDQAIYAAAKTDITAKNIGISANGGWAVYTEPNANVVAGITAKETANIQGSIYANFAKSVTVDAGKLNMLGYVYNYGSNVTVGLGTEGSLTGKVISAYDGTTTIDMGTNSTWNVTDDSTVTGLAGENAQINKAQTQKATTDNTTVTVNNANADTTNVVLKDTSLEFTDVDLIVNSDRVSKDKYGNLTPDTTGMLANTTIKSNSGVVINQTGNNAALGYLTKTNIEADSIKVTAEGQGAWAVYNVYNTDEHILKANEIELASKGRTVFSQDGNIKITADKLKVTSDRSAEEKKNSAITVNSTGKVNVNADEVVLVGGIDLIGADTAEVNFKSADESATPQTMQITGDINAKKGKLTGLSLDGEESFIKGAINTAGNTNAAVTFSNGATWIANAESAVQKFGGQDGVIVVDEAILGTAGAVTIADNTSTGTVVKAKNISLAGGAKKALSGLEEKLQSTVTATGTALTYQAAVLDTELRGDVEFKDGKVITTMDTDTLIAREDVKADGDVWAGDVSLRETAATLGTAATDISELEAKTAGISRTQYSGTTTGETKVTDDFVVDTKEGKGSVTIGYMGENEMLFTTNDEGKYTFGVNAQTGEMQVNGGAEFGKKADGTYNVEINDEGVAIQSGMSVAGGKFDVSDTGKVTATNGMKVQTTGKGNVVVGDINGNTMLYTTGENGYVFGVEANTGNIETKGTLRVANDNFVVDTLGNTAIKGSLSVDKDVKVDGGLEVGTDVKADGDVWAGDVSLRETAATLGTAATDISELEAKTAGISRTQYSGTTTGETKVTDDFVVDTKEGKGSVTIGYMGENEMLFTTNDEGKYTFGVNAQTGEMQVNGGAEFGKKADGTYNVEINDEGVAVQSGLSVAGGKFDVSDTGKVTASNGMKVQTSGEGSFSFANIGTDETLFYAMSTDSSKTNPTIVMNAQNGNIETQGSLSVGNGAFVSDAASGNAAVKGSLAVGSDANVAGGVNVETNVIAKGDVFAGEGEKQVSLKETAKQVAVQGDKITALENASSEQSNKIGALENLTTEHSNKIGALEDLTSEHSNKIGALENLTAEQGNKITALENSDKEQSNKITALENATGEQSGKITALENASTEQAGKITALENDSAEQAGKITALENDSAEQSGKITALENSDAVQNTAIAKNSEAISGLNQRLGKMNGKVNKVGAGAAALAALHPLEYDPDDKLTFSAGVGNYNGENAAALGAFYRPDEKLMFSLGGTMGNGENMVNLGVSIGLDGAKGGAKLSKKELIQKVSTMEAENAAIKAENDALEDRVAKLEALVAKLAEK